MKTTALALSALLLLILVIVVAVRRNPVTSTEPTPTEASTPEPASPGATEPHSGPPVLDTTPSGADTIQTGDASVEEPGAVSVEEPRPEEAIRSPLVVRGEARGSWYFEGTFPVILTDWDGRILAEALAQALGEWTTDAFVPFEARLTFDSPYRNGDPDYMRRGSLILRNANPSGRPDLDRAVEIVVAFSGEG